MTLLRTLGAFERVLVWLAAGWLGIGGLAFVPSPWSILDAFQTVPLIEIKKAPALALESLPSLERFDVIAARPLFNPDRVPDPEVSPAGAAGPVSSGPVLGDLSAYRVVGIAGDGVTNIALVLKSGGETLRLKKGDSMEGWIVVEVGANGVSISGGGRKQILTIPKAENRQETP